MKEWTKALGTISLVILILWVAVGYIVDLTCEEFR